LTNVQSCVVRMLIVSLRAAKRAKWSRANEAPRRLTRRSVSIASGSREPSLGHLASGSVCFLAFCEWQESLILDRYGA
jgi:hypothetical protein